MLKILETKKWLTLEEAARYLECHLSEAVSADDVLYFIAFDDLVCSCVLNKVNGEIFTYQSVFPLINEVWPDRLLNPQNRPDQKTQSQYRRENYAVTGYFPIDGYYIGPPDEDPVEGVFQICRTAEINQYLRELYFGNIQSRSVVDGFYVSDSKSIFKIYPSMWYLNIDLMDCAKLEVLDHDDKSELVDSMSEGLADAVAQVGGFDEDDDRYMSLIESLKVLFRYTNHSGVCFQRLESLITEYGGDSLLLELPDKSELVIQQHHIQLFLEKINPVSSELESQQSIKRSLNFAPQQKNKMLKLIRSLSIALIGGTTGSAYNDAVCALNTAKEKGVDLPISDRKFMDYLEEAKGLDSSK